MGPQDWDPSILYHTIMGSFFKDLKLLHPYLKLPSGSESSTWKEKLVDTTISPDEWAAHAKEFLREIDGADYRSLFADTDIATPDHDGVLFSTAITEYMLKDVTKTIVRCADEAYIKDMTYWLPGWQEICGWSTETRFARFDQFLDFVATVCRWFVPAQAEKGRNTLACATLIEIHYLVLLLDYSSKAYKHCAQNEDRWTKREFKSFLDRAFDIFLRCDSALYTLTKFDKDWPLYCSSLKSRLTVAIYDAAKRYNIMPTHMHVKGITKIGRDPVGSGGFADVWKGMVNGTVVALKVPRLHCDGVDLKILEAQTCKEGFIWSRLSHENILPLLGFHSTGNDPIIMVSPWMDNGNLTTYLKLNESANRQELMYGVYRGLCYLHSREPSVAHGDLRCANILVDNLGKPLISDFGLSRVQDLQLSLPTGYASGVSGGSYRWQAPELWRGAGKHTTSSDVYAYAMTCLEVYSGEKPLGNYTEAQFILKFAKGVVLEIPESIKTSNSRLAQAREVWWQDLERCCSATAAHRPSIIEAICMVCVFNPDLWQPNVCSSDYNGLQAIRAHESCNPSECIWTCRGLSIAAKNNTTRQSVTKDVIYLETVEQAYLVGSNELIRVSKGVMDGNTVGQRMPTLAMTNGMLGDVDITQIKEIINKIKDECIVWSQLRHRNVLPLLGISTSSDPIGITLITPWIENSTLVRRMQECSISDPYKILNGVYEGLCHLHSRMPPIVVHGEICSSILLDTLDNPLIADYGLAKILGYRIFRNLDNLREDTILRWMAPELKISYPSGWKIDRERLTTMSDVYAFALLCLAIYSGRPYFFHRFYPRSQSPSHQGHHPPRIPYSLKTSNNQLASMREKWWAKLRTCWATNPMDRPAVEDMKHMLYFPALVDDHRNEAHGYILGTDDDDSHESCEDKACFWTFTPKNAEECFLSEDEDGYLCEDEDGYLCEDEDGYF